MTIQVIKDGAVKITVPGVEIRNGFPQMNGNYFVSKEACEAAGIDPKQAGLSKKAPTEKTASLYLRMGMNPDGNEIVDEAVRRAAEQAKYNRQTDAAKREKFAAQIAEAATSGKDVVISIERWTETRRAKEGGQWGDYVFLCSRTEWVTPAGEFKTKSSAVNSY